VKYGNAYEWSPWVELPGLTAEGAPSVTYHTRDDRFWIAAAQSGTGTIHLTTYDGITGPQPWTQPGGGAPPAPGTSWVPSDATITWLAPPAVASDGRRVHLYGAAQLASPNGTWWSIFHKIENGSGWGSWRPFRTGALSGAQPAATNVYAVEPDDGDADEYPEHRGEVLLLTDWPATGLSEIGSD
jgi:hypothetical protein